MNPGPDASACDGHAGAPQPIRGRDMLCFSHDWSGDPLSKTHLMRLLARDNRVLWVNSIGYRAPTASRRDAARAVKKILAAAAPVREAEPNLHVLSPLVIPAYGSATIRRFNRWFLRWQVRRAMRRLNFQRPINWVFNPAAALIAGSLGEDRLIYYCVDEYAAFSGVRADALAAMERDLLARADLVITSSERLYRAKRPHNPRTVLVRHGVDWSHFRAALDPSTSVPDDLARLSRPILGYHGLIARDWVDVELVAHTARRLPDVSIAMIGRSTMDLSALRGLPNVHLLGHRPYATLPGYCRGFDAAMIPFPVNDATLHANPLKAREYLAAGLPVVSTAIPEVEVLDARIGRDPDEFVQQVRAALAAPGPSANRSDAIRHESWDARLAEIAAHVHAIPARQPRIADHLLPAPTPAPAARPRSLVRTIAQDIREKSLWCYENDRPRDLLKTLVTDGTAAMILYRLMQRSRRYRLPTLEAIFNKLNSVLCNCIIGRGAEFGPGFVLIHSTGVVINGSVRAGSSVRIEHQVTIGAERRRAPVIGDGVFIGAGAKIIGPVTVGDGAFVGANAVVVDDVPPGHTAVGIPARMIAPKESKRLQARFVA